MPRPKSIQDPALLEAALEGLKIQQKRIEEQIAQVGGMLGHHTPRRGRPPSKKTAAATGKKRVLSAAARKRIAAAQKRRWAQFRKNASAAAE